jgi:hypothetical protein
MKINKIRVAGIGCLAAVTGLVTAASMVLTAPADAAKTATHADHAAIEAHAPNESGSCVADASSVCSGFGQATNNSVSSGDSIADNGSVASGCSVALDHSMGISSGLCLYGLIDLSIYSRTGNMLFPTRSSRGKTPMSHG